MGLQIYTWCTALVLCVHISAVPYANEDIFLRSAVETIPPHQPVATPIRAFVESIPPRNLRDEGNERLPLRDAVEKRPILTPDRENLYRFIEDTDKITEDVPGLRKYYGAATYLNSGNRNDERLQQGNANLQEMQQTATGPAGRRLVVCYMESWAAYRSPPLAFTAGLVPKSCTNLHYAFATLHPHTYVLTSNNEDYDLIKGGYRIATGLKRRVAGLRVLISVGGLGTGRLFSEMAKEPARRRAFVDSAVEFLRENDFDGLDLHWVYPGEKDEKEKEYLTSLLYELREKFSPYGLLLSTVLPPFRYQIEDGYDMSAVSGATDYAILQGWDMTHRNTEEAPSRALQHSPLHRDPGAASRDQRYNNIEFMVKFIVRRGMAAEKLILGVPLFGRSYTLAASTLPYPGAPVIGWGNEGTYTQTKGLLAFFEVCMALREGKGSSGIDEDGNAYGILDNQWISYDSPVTIVEKMKFVISNGLGGAAAWAIDMDDFRGLCGSPFPILSAISVSLNGENVQSNQSSLKIGSCEADSTYLSSDEISCAHFHFCEGGSRYKLICEDERLYDPSTGFCGHQDVAKCIPGQSLRISVDDATRHLAQAYDSDFEWNGSVKEVTMNNEPERQVDQNSIKKTQTITPKTKTNNCSSHNAHNCQLEKMRVSLKESFNNGPDYKVQTDHKSITKLQPSILNVAKTNTNRGVTNLKYGIEYYKHPERLSDYKLNTTSLDNNENLPTLSEIIKLSKEEQKYTPTFSHKENMITDITSNDLFTNKEECSFVSCNQNNNKILTGDSILKYGIEYYKHPNIAADYFNLNNSVTHDDLVPTLVNTKENNVSIIIVNSKPLQNSLLDDKLIDIEKNKHNEENLNNMAIQQTNPKNENERKEAFMLNFGIEYYKNPEKGTDYLNSDAYANNIIINNNYIQTNINHISQILSNTNVQTPETDNDDGYHIDIPQYFENDKPMSIEITNYNQASFITDTEFNSPGIQSDDTIFVANNNTEVVTNDDRDSDKRVVCYMTSWAFYRRGDGKFVPEYIDTRLCTHVVYAYASLTPDDLVAKEFDPWADVTNNLYERVTSLNDVKVLLGLGGWTDSAGDKYSRLVSSGAARTNFIQKVVAFLRNNNFQGLHLDWNYPVCWQSNCKKGAMSDKANFAKLVQELSIALHSANMELGVAVSGYKEVIEAAYDLPALSNAADFISTMTYDYHGGWERTTAHHTPLSPAVRDSLAHYSIEYAINALISGGADPKKLNLGLSFYGQSYRLSDADGSKTPGVPAAGPGEPGEFTKQPGMLAYYEICYRVKNLRWKTGRQDKAGPYAYSDSQWVGYDDSKSITEKVEWALEKGLGGITAWAIDLDDFNNRCCAEPSPLLRAAGRALGRSVPSPPNSPCERPPQPVTPAPPTTTTVAADGSSGGTAGAGTSGDHNHGSHGDHTSTTWPSWNPTPSTTTSTTTTPSTAMTWWPQSTTTSTTRKPTTTTTTTTTRRPTSAPTKPADSASVEGASCVAGEYHAAPGDCESYLQCEGGHWRKNRCAPGLHWAAEVTRCDWPNFAKCSVQSPSQANTATSTLAPMTSRPPPTSTTTTRRPFSTTTTTTRRPFTTTTTTTQSTSVTSGGSSEGKQCSIQDYTSVTGDCNAYLQCDGTTWKMQRCAPGLHWSQQQKHCDWPKYAKCEDSTFQSTTLKPKPTSPPRPARPTTTNPSDIAMEDGSCTASESSHASSSSCDTYLLCVGGKWKKQNCPPGLHWDDRSKRCDWMEFAMCDMKARQTTKMPTTQRSTTARTTTTTRRPAFTRPPTTTTRRPVIMEAEDTLKPGTSCRTGSYHAHPRCDKFFVCVNGILIAQSCAPGLLWNAEQAQCDFPSSTSCSDRRQTSEGRPDGTMSQLKICDTGAYAPFPGECSRYKHCLYGQYQEFSCSAGLHWNEEKQICDWPKNAKCKNRDSTKPSNSIFNEIVSPPKEPQLTHEGTKPTVIKPITSKPASATITDYDVEKPALIKSQYKLVCYYTNWAWYRPGLGQYGPEDIDPTLCTHIIYGFAVLGSDGLLSAHDPWADTENNFYKRVVDYKKYGIKVSLALGGWNDSAGDKYSKLVNDPEARASFVTNAVEFIQQYGFDGLDLDWEYPKCWQVDCSKGPESDKQAFSKLIRELSAAFKPKGLLLSSAVSPNKKVIDEGYEVPVLAKYLDWIAVMTYDYHGQWDKKTGHVAPLYYHPDDDNTYFNANYTMHYWIEKGAPPSKLIMGMPMYGQSFTTGTQWDTDPELAEKKDATGLNVPAVAGGEPGEYTRAKGFLAYYEICERIKEKGWILKKDSLGRMGPYAYKNDQWVSFDDTEILKKKVQLIKSLKLAGGMIWALDLDDFKNRCGQGKHPLLNTIKNSLLDSKLYPEYMTPEPMINKDEDDLEDIEVIPSYTKRTTTTPRPAFTMQMGPIQTTKKPVLPLKPEQEERFKVVCYYTNWAWYRPNSGKYSPSDIDPALCTHIIYAFAVLDSSKLIMKPHDTWLDVENKFYEKVVSLKSKGIKVLLGLGGWNDSAGDKYSRLINSASARRTFVVHALDFIEQFDFDGLDLDWEYPKCWQVECEKGPASDKQGFANLVKELRAAFSPRGLLLSAAVSPSKRVIDAGYDVPVLSKNLDWIAIMTYDYHGQWDKKTGHVAPMYVSDQDVEKTFNVNFTMHYWMQKGASAEKLVMGIPMYGQSFSLVEHAGTGLGAPALAGGEPGDETRARGFLAFYEICERIRIRGWKVTRDPGGRMGPYAFSNDQWVSFDDDFMVRHKAEYVRSMGFGGSMVWSMDLDDFTGKYCGCGKAPLLSTINHVLRGSKAPQRCSLEEIKAPEDQTTQIAVSVTEPATTQTDERAPDPTLPNNEEEFDTTTKDGSLDGKTCTGIKFAADPIQCDKYYLCNNGKYFELRCPSPLHWNKNHCDWPTKATCKSRAQLRLTSEDGQREHNIDKPIIACYFTNWAYYRQGNGKYGPDQVDGSLCTHIIYAWARLDQNTSEVVAGNPELDLENDFYGKITEQRLSGVKVILGVGGLEDSEDYKWSQLAADPNKRKLFVESAVKFLQRWKFDGLQLAWQYPVCKEAPCEEVNQSDKENFNMLLLKLSKKLRLNDLEISAMVAASPEIAVVAYDPEILVASLDWVAVAANDYYASSSGRTSYLVSLESRENTDVKSFNASLVYWTSVIPLRQLVIGVPAYARSYTLRNPTVNVGHGAAVTGPGKPGPYSNVPGFLAYNEICSSNWTETTSAEGTYAQRGSQWASYLRVSEVSQVARSVREAGARGAAFWALDLDDWRAECACAPYPLLRALRQPLLDLNDLC